MKKIIRFSRAFLPSAIFSVVLIAVGLAGYVLKGGFNLGVDFQAGLIQEVQFAPPALRLTYSGLGNASISFDRNNLFIVMSGSGVEGTTYAFPYDQYANAGAIAAALSGVDGVSATLDAPSDTPTRLFVQSAAGNPQLGANPFIVHYLPENAAPVSIEDVRESLSPLGTVSVQVLGAPSERRFMIRMQDSDAGESVPAAAVIQALANSPAIQAGADGIAVTSSNYVGSRFSEALSHQAGILMALTLVIILFYASFRFKPQYAIGAVLAIAHDALIMVAFIAWTRMEFNTTTIAAILTILGYSINDTIVIFDRIRETRRLYPEESFVETLNRSLSETLGRTIITTVTTMLAVVSLFIFTTGSMKDFALALLIGMTSGVYSTIFIACGFVKFWNDQAEKKEKKHAHTGAAAPVHA